MHWSTRTVFFWAALALLVSLASAQQVKPFDRVNFDTTCAPCKDFFQFADGGWVRLNPIPPAYSRWGTFSELEERNKTALRGILDDAAKKAADMPDGNVKLMGTFYASCMDTLRSETDGAAPLADELTRIGAIQSPADLQAGLARLNGYGLGVVFGLGSAQDFKNSSQVIAVADQGGLGLPDRDYYTRTDSASAKMRREYQAHVARTLELLGDPPSVAEYEGQRIMALETALANASMTRVERRDPEKRYHKMTVVGLKALTPSFDWGAYLASANLAGVTDLNVANPVFFKSVDSLLAKAPILDWRSYLRWHLAAHAAPWLSPPFVSEDFRFQQLLTGAKEMFPRWRRCLTETDVDIGEALGQAYVEQSFTPQAKARALAMVQNLTAALRDRLNTLSWMQPATRAQALAKLDALTKKIGYPDKWRDYSGVEVRPGPFILNELATDRFEVRRQLAKIGKPVDRIEWTMTPPTVNAYYNSLRNEIVFPAGILQPPFFDPQADDALNYGGIGAVIGHEMTHGFDDQGRKFDAAGNLKEWWTPEDAKRYTTEADKVAKQFDGYVIEVDSLHVNGHLTLGENIADLGGLKIAHAALEKALAGKPRPPRIDGYTPEQRFFLSWANVWRQSDRPEDARLRITTDSHSPARWRVDGPLSNLAEFRQAWGCKAGDEMVRADSLRAEIW